MFYAYDLLGLKPVKEMWDGILGKYELAAGTLQRLRERPALNTRCDCEDVVATDLLLV